MKANMYLLIICANVLSLGCQRSSFDYASEQPDLEKISGENSEILVSNNNYADGVTPAKIEVILRNSKRQALINREVQLIISGDFNVLTPCTHTDSQGIAICWLYTTKAEAKRVSLRDDVVVWKEVDFDLPPTNKSAAAIVAAGSHQHLVSGHKMTATAGNVATPFIMRDSFNQFRAESSILSRMPKQ